MDKAPDWAVIVACFFGSAFGTFISSVVFGLMDLRRKVNAILAERDGEGK